MNRDSQERQRAFIALLMRPVIDRRDEPELWPLVRRHRAVLTEWFASRLGYRLVVTNAAARLFRLPLGGRITAPSRFRPPSRRVLVLAILAAAAAAPPRRRWAQTTNGNCAAGTSSTRRSGR